MKKRKGEENWDKYSSLRKPRRGERLPGWAHSTTKKLTVDPGECQVSKVYPPVQRRLISPEVLQAVWPGMSSGLMHFEVEPSVDGRKKIKRDINPRWGETVTAWGYLRHFFSFQLNGGNEWWFKSRKWSRAKWGFQTVPIQILPPNPFGAVYYHARLERCTVCSTKFQDNNLSQNNLCRANHA